MSYTQQIDSKTSAKMRNLITVITLITVLLWSTTPPLIFGTVFAKNSAQQSATLQGRVEAITDDSAGLDRVIITHAKGGAQSFVNLPSGIKAGDTFSGTVITEPKGKTAEERAASLAEIKDQFIEISGENVAATGGKFELTMPKGEDTGPCGPIIIWGPFKKRFPCFPGPMDPIGPYVPPPYAQVGRPIEIKGPFDGKFGPGDHVKVGDDEMMLLAQSPGKTIFFNTSPAIGPTVLEVSEGETVHKSRFHNFHLSMTVDESDLRKNQGTKLRLVVKGLKDLHEELPLHLQNHSVNVITMEGGNVQKLTIGPKDVKPGGVYELVLQLTSIQVGVFSIVGTITWNHKSPAATENRTAARIAGNEAGLPTKPLPEPGSHRNRPTAAIPIIIFGRSGWDCRGSGWGCLVILGPLPPWGPYNPLDRMFSAAPSFEGNAEVRQGAQPTLYLEFKSALSKDVRTIPVDRDVPLEGSIAESLGFKSVTILSGNYPIDPSLGKSGGVTFNVSVRKAWTADPRNPDNPFDSTGRRHNEALDYLLTRKEKFVVNEVVMKDAVLTELAEKICTDELARQPTTAAQNSTNCACVAKVVQQMQVTSLESRQPLDKMDLSAKLTTAQIKTLKEIETQIGLAFAKSGKGPDAAIQNIKAIEARVSKTMSQGDSEAHEIILNSASVARYTIAYWYDESSDDYSRWRGVGDVGEQLKALKPYNDDKAAKADFKGAVAGGIGGFIGGGPTAPFAAVMGVVGGAIGSSVVNIGEQLGWW